jgi:hypothetical protein
VRDVHTCDERDACGASGAVDLGGRADGVLVERVDEVLWMIESWVSIMAWVEEEDDDAGRGRGTVSQLFFGQTCSCF